MLYDGGTVGRGYDFNDQSEADKYFQNCAATLFPCNKFAEFEQAVNGASINSQHNEVMARLRWTKGCKIIIGSNTLESRLLAQDRARTLKARLQEQAGELGVAWYDCEIPLIFYMPYTEMHGSEYTKEMQNQDRMAASKIYSNAILRRQKITNLDFEFLLGLNSDQIKWLLEFEKIDFTCLFLYIIFKGYVYIARSLLELAPGFEEFLKKQLFTWGNIRENVYARETAYIRVLRAQDEKLAILFQQSLLLEQSFRGKLSRIVEEQRDPLCPPCPLETVLSKAAQKGRFKYVQWLDGFIDSKEWGNVCATNAFHYALNANNFEIAKHVINMHGFNPNGRTHDGATVMHLAVELGVFDVCKLLVEKGADLTTENKKGKTPLEYAVSKQRLSKEEIKALLQLGLDSYLKEIKERSEDFRPNKRILAPFAVFGYGYSKTDKIEAAEYMHDLLLGRETDKTRKYAEGPERDRMQGILNNGRLAGFWRVYLAVGSA